MAKKAKAAPAKKAKAPAKKSVAVKKEAAKGEVVPAAEEHPLQTLRDEVNRLFETFETGMGLWPRRGGMFDIEPFFQPFRQWEPVAFAKHPRADVVETDKAFQVTAELPGMEEKDVEVTLSEGVLTIKGETSEEKEEKEKDYHVSERRYGMYRRSFSLPKTVDADKIQAKMKAGVLSVTLPKMAAAEKAVKKIGIQKG